jgi:hypothetical protein
MPLAALRNLERWRVVAGEVASSSDIATDSPGDPGPGWLGPFRVDYRDSFRSSSADRRDVALRAAESSRQGEIQRRDG